MKNIVVKIENSFVYSYEEEANLEKVKDMISAVVYANAKRMYETLGVRGISENYEEPDDILDYEVSFEDEEEKESWPK